MGIGGNDAAVRRAGAEEVDFGFMGQPRTRRPLLQRQLVQARGFRLVGVACQPGGKLAVGGAVSRMQIALRQHMAHQAMVAQPADQ